MSRRVVATGRRLTGPAARATLAGVSAAPPDPRPDFRLAAEGFVTVVQSIAPDRWGDPALGVWTVRDLAGHAGRALLTVESYLEPEPRGTQPELGDAVAYYRRAAADLADPDAVAERGRRAGEALGDQPAASVAATAQRVLALVADAPDDATVATPIGVIRLLDYLPTRTFELVVHSLDLCAATGAPVPASLSGPIGACLHLAVDLADADGHGPDVLLALTGRRPLPGGFSVV